MGINFSYKKWLLSLNNTIRDEICALDRIKSKSMKFSKIRIKRLRHQNKLECNICKNIFDYDKCYTRISRCKECHKSDRIKYYKNNKDRQIKKMLEYNKKHSKKHKERVKASIAKKPDYYKDYHKSYYIKNKPTLNKCHNEWSKVRMKSDPIFK